MPSGPSYAPIGQTSAALSVHGLKVRMERLLALSLEQAPELAFRGIVGRPPRFAGGVDPDRFPHLTLHLDDGRLPAGVVRLRQDPELTSLELQLLRHNSSPQLRLLQNCM